MDWSFNIVVFITSNGQFFTLLYLFVNDWWLILIVFPKSLGLLFVSVF